AHPRQPSRCPAAAGTQAGSSERHGCVRSLRGRRVLNMAIETQHYLLLDGAQIDDLIQIIYQLEPTPEFSRLYDGTRYAELADAGPILIATNRGSLLNQYFEKQWYMTAGVALASRAPSDELVQHLSSLVHVCVSGGVTVLFRYYDPRI